MPRFKIKLLYSFLSVFTGWVSGFAYYVIYSTVFSPWGRPTDIQAILFWTAVFITISWLIFVLPLIILLPDTSKINTFPLTPVFGAGFGLIAFILVVGWWTNFWAVPLYVGYSLVVGLFAGLAYSGFLHYHRSRSDLPG